MAMEFDLDFGGKTAAEAEKDQSRIPEGYYFATFTEMTVEETKMNTTLNFTISRGDQKGRKTHIMLPHPLFVEADTQSAKEEKQKKAKSRIGTIATRMGALDPAVKSGKTNFGSCVGKEFIIEIRHQQGDKGTFANISYCGVYPATGHDDIPNAVRPSLGLALKEGKKGGKKEAAATGGSGDTGSGSSAPPAGAASGLWK